MEVSVLSQSHLPDDALLSVRSGTTRRQAPISGGRPLVFPCHSTKPLQVDILQKIASASIVPRPSETQGCYQVQLNPVPGSGKQGMRCELLLKAGADTTSKAPSSAGPPEVSSHQPSAVASAKEYLERTRVMEFIQAAVQVIIRERPDDPFEALIRHLARGYDAINTKPGPALGTPPDKRAAPLSSEYDVEGDGTAVVQCHAIIGGPLESASVTFSPCLMSQLDDAQTIKSDAGSELAHDAQAASKPQGQLAGAPACSRTPRFAGSSRSTTQPSEDNQCHASGSRPEFATRTAILPNSPIQPLWPGWGWPQSFGGHPEDFPASWGKKRGNPDTQSWSSTTSSNDPFGHISPFLGPPP